MYIYNLDSDHKDKFLQEKYFKISLDICLFFVMYLILFFIRDIQFYIISIL